MCESEPNGAGLSIRRMNEGDADALYGVLSDPEIMRYLEPPYSREATVQFLQFQKKKKKKKKKTWPSTGKICIWITGMCVVCISKS